MAADSLIADFRRKLALALKGKVRTRERDLVRRDLLQDFKDEHPVAFITMVTTESILVETMLIGNKAYGPIPEGFMKEQRELEFLSSCRRVESIVLALLDEHSRIARLGHAEDAQSLLIEDDDESSSPEC